MYSLAIALPGSIVWVAMFKTKESAEKAWEDINDSTKRKITDDFGQKIRADQFIGAILEDMEQSKLAHIERELHTARLRVKIQQAAQNDPVIKTAGITGGPAMLSPMAPNGGRVF